MKLFALTVILVACATPSRDPIDAPSLPDGVFTPDHTVGAAELRMLADGDSLWFAYTTGSNEARDLWIAKMTTDGEPEIEPKRVNEDSVGAAQPALAQQGDAIAVAYRSSLTLVVRTRLYDRSSKPVRPATDITFEPSTVPWRFELVARPGGGYRMVSSTLDATGEILVLDLDGNGEPTSGSMRLGTNPATMASSPSTLGAASASDDRTLIVWDRVYENCTGRLPYEALAATTTPSVEPLIDSPGQSEWQPAVATFETSAYAAWRTDFELHSTISLARFDEPAILATVGEATAFNSSPVLAMNGAARGAIAWQVDGEHNLAMFRDTGTSILLGPIHVIRPVSVTGKYLTNTNLVSVGDDRFALGWVENEPSGEQRIYAKVVDLAGPPSPARPRASSSGHRERARIRPCSH